MPNLVTARQNEDVWLTLFAEYPVFRCISQNLSPGWLRKARRVDSTVWSVIRASDRTHGALEEIIIR
jgi:hypothetical protein